MAKKRLSVSGQT